MHIFRQSDIQLLVSKVGFENFSNQLLARLENAFRQVSTGNFRSPARDGFTTGIAGELSLVEWMPSAASDGSTAIKLVGYYPTNPNRHNLPTILATTVLFEKSSGAVEAVFEATTLTCLRTAAASALASRHLASPESQILGLVGCGAQALGQTHALLLHFPIRKILYCDTDPATQHSFPNRIRAAAPDLFFEPATPETVANQSDIICTQTTTPPNALPVLPHHPQKPHCHINAVGSDFPGKRELPLSLLQSALVVPDHRQQAIREGECQPLPPEAIGPDLATLCAAPENWTSQQDSLTVFDSTGCAIEDLVAAKMVAELAPLHGIGGKIDFENHAVDPKDPYAGIFATPPKTASSPGHPHLTV